MNQRTCRWGILGTAAIARKNWASIRHSENGTLAAVASRSHDRAQEFIRGCQAQVPFETVPRACTYEELLASQDIDAVYIPLPTGIRKEWVIRAANAGKHVLCEKPCASNASDLADMIAACSANRVQFMDGVMFMHSQRLGAIREVLNDGTSIGELRRIVSQFSFQAPDGFFENNIRASDQLEPLGCLGDLGWYNIRFILLVMNYELPQRVSGRMLAATAAGVPVEFSGELLFRSGVSASFFCSFQTLHQQWSHVSGSRGNLTVPDFVLPYYGNEVAFFVSNDLIHIDVCQYNMEQHGRRIAVREYGNNAPTAQETKLFRNFGSIVNSGELDLNWGSIALKTQQVVDVCLQSAQDNGCLIDVTV